MHAAARLVAAHPTATQPHLAAVPAPAVPKRILARPEPLLRPAHARPVAAPSTTEARQVVPRQTAPKPAAAAAPVSDPLTFLHFEISIAVSHLRLLT